MIVALDAQLSIGTATGIGVYQRDLAAALSARGVPVRPLRAAWLDPWRFDRRLLWDQMLLPLAIVRCGATLAHATAGTMPFARSVPTVVTVHDMAWLRVQAHTRGYARAYFGAAMRQAYKRAAAVIVDSHFGAAEYRTLSGDERAPQVIYPGVDARYRTIVRRPDAAPFGLVVGTVEARKNLIAVIDAAAALPGLRIVSVGPPTPYLDLVRERIERHGITGRVELRGYVGQPELDDLYARATFALVPSRYEGFGYAVAEARCAGLPFIAARGSSLSEVAGAAGELVDPDDTPAWTHAMLGILEDRAAAQNRADAGRSDALAHFDWSVAAAQHEMVYTQISERARHPRR